MKMLENDDKKVIPRTGFEPASIFMVELENFPLARSGIEPRPPED